MQLAAAHSDMVRERIARRCRIPIDQLTPQTKLFGDLEMDSASFAFLLNVLESAFEVKLLPSFKNVLSAYQSDADGRLTPQSQQQLEQLLPGIEWEATTPMEEDDIWTVGAMEALVAKALADRRPAPSGELTWQSEREDWLQTLPEQLGERKLRLLLAAACRDAFATRPNLEREVIGGLETLEQFADTGKTKAALRESQKALEQYRLDRVPELNALHLSLAANKLKAALSPACKAIKSGRELSHAEAFEQFRAFHRDLVSPLPETSRFEGQWRSPSVVNLARTMYESRDFGVMPHLAEALGQAGCQEEEILKHCRDANVVHVRGCWVVDAVLDGSWAKPPKETKSKAKGGKTSKEPKTLLATLAKREQYQVMELMDRPGAQAPLEEIIAKRWDFQAACRAEGMAEERIEHVLAVWAGKMPYLTNDQVRTSISFGVLRAGLDDTLAIARRVFFDNPSELGLIVSLACRLRWMDGLLSPFGDPRPAVLEAFAIRDLAVAKRMSESVWDARCLEEDRDYHSLAAIAILRGETDKFTSYVDGMTKRKATARQQGMDGCFRGIAQRDPQLVIQSIEQVVETERRSRNKEGKRGFGVTLLTAHGLFRLAEWVSPDLVAGFDVNKALPWDAPFHAWSEAHADPMEGLDLGGISPLLHEAVVKLQLPDWWKRPKTEGNPKDICEVVLTDPGPNRAEILSMLRPIAGGSLLDAKKLVDNLPAVLHAGIYRFNADELRRLLESKGAKVEVRLMKSK